MVISGINTRMEYRRRTDTLGINDEPMHISGDNFYNLIQNNYRSKLRQLQQLSRDISSRHQAAQEIRYLAKQEDGSHKQPSSLYQETSITKAQQMISFPTNIELSNAQRTVSRE